MNLKQYANLQSLSLARAVYVDDNGYLGTEYPLGTSEFPVLTFAQALIIAAARNNNTFVIHGSHALAAAMEHYNFMGYTHMDPADIINLNGQDVDASGFYRLVVSGAQGGTGYVCYYDCLLLSVTGLRGFVRDCCLHTAIGFATGGANDNVDLINCHSSQGGVTITVNTPDLINFYRWSGEMTLQTMGGGTVNIWAVDGAVINIAASCTLGTINIYGSATVVNNSGGTVVFDHTWEATKVEAYGTADAGSDADTLVDAALTQGDDYWNGLTLLMITGANAGLTRPIADFTDVGDTMELRPAFPAAIAANDVYAILSNYHEVVPAADSAENYSPRDVLGNKADTALQAATAADSLVRYVKGLLLGQSRQLFTMDFWSDPQEEVQVPQAAGTLVITPTVTVADLPAGAAIVRAIAMFKFRMIENIYAGVNKLDGATVATTSQVIQVKETTAGAYIDAINFVDDQFTLADGAREGGDCLIGSIDIVGQVDGNDSYTFQWLLRKADQDFINFNDVQVGLRIWYSV